MTDSYRPSSHQTPENAIELGAGSWISESHLRYSFSRSSGPGGQSVNKLCTRAELRILVVEIVGLNEITSHRLRLLAGQRLTKADEIVIHADVHRSQPANKRECLHRLQKLVQRALAVPKARIKVKPTRSMIEKRLAAKKQQSRKKDNRAWKRERE